MRRDATGGIRQQAVEKVHEDPKGETKEFSNTRLPTVAGDSLSKKHSANGKSSYCYNIASHSPGGVVSPKPSVPARPMTREGDKMPSGAVFCQAERSLEWE